MNKFLKTILLGLIGLAATQSSASAETYKVIRDFSYLNPGGVWSYGYGVTGTSFAIVAPIENGCGTAGGRNDCFRHGNALVYMNTSGSSFVDPGSGTVLVGDNVLMMHPDAGVDAIVRFRAPRVGTYTFKGSFTIMDASPTGIAPKIFAGTRNITKAAFKSASDVTLTGPGADLARKKPGGSKRFAFSRTLQRGQVVYFGVNDLGNWTFDSTAFKLEVQIGDP